MRVRVAYFLRSHFVAIAILSLVVVVILTVVAYSAERGPRASVPSSDRARAAARVATASGGHPVRTSCAATTAVAICLVTVYVPEPLDACQDWSVDVDFTHHVGPVRWLGTRGCFHGR
jgi:hypothetical protein